MKTTMKHDAIIIGAGLGGLACGSILSQAGMRVLVLEQGAQVGGCLQSYHRRGAEFDTGFHYVGGLDEGQSLHSAFKGLGLLDLPWHLMDREFDRITIGNENYSIAQGYEVFVDTLAQCFPQERDALLEFVEVMKVATAGQYTAIDPRHVDVPAMPEALSQSAWQYLEQHFRDRRLIDVLGGSMFKLELRRQSLPLFTLAHTLSGYLESSWRLKGSGQQIAGALADGITARGGTIITGAIVRELIERDGKVVAVRLQSGEEIEADHFVSSAHPAVTMDMLHNSKTVRPLYRRRITSLENTAGMFTVSLALKQGTLPYFNWNQYVYDKYDVWSIGEDNMPVKGIMISCRVPDDNSGFTTQLDLMTPMDWSQCERWTATRVGHRGGQYMSWKEMVASQCIALASRFIPGLETMIEQQQVSTPLTYRDYTLSPHGSAYGVRKDYRNALMTNLSPRTPLPNLLLTGQSLIVHGLHGTTMAALLTASEVVGKEFVYNNYVI